MSEALNYNYSSPNNSKAFETRTIKALDVDYVSPPFAQIFFPVGSLMIGTYWKEAIYTIIPKQPTASVLAFAEHWNNGITFDLRTRSIGTNVDHKFYENGNEIFDVGGQTAYKQYQYPINLSTIQVEHTFYPIRSVDFTTMPDSDEITGVWDYKNEAGETILASFPVEFQAWKQGWLVPSNLLYNIAYNTSSINSATEVGVSSLFARPHRFIIKSCTDNGDDTADVVIQYFRGSAGNLLRARSLDNTLLDGANISASEDVEVTFTLPIGETVKFRAEDSFFNTSFLNFEKQWVVTPTANTSVKMTKELTTGNTLLTAASMPVATYDFLIVEVWEAASAPDTTAVSNPDGGTDIPPNSNIAPNGGRMYKFGSLDDLVPVDGLKEGYPQDRRNRELAGLF